MFGRPGDMEEGARTAAEVEILRVILLQPEDRIGGPHVALRLEPLVAFLFQRNRRGPIDRVERSLDDLVP
jgi:hypothetical protein